MWSKRVAEMVCKDVNDEKIWFFSFNTKNIIKEGRNKI